MLVSVENMGHKYDFQGVGWGGLWQGLRVGRGWWSRSNEKRF